MPELFLQGRDPRRRLFEFRPEDVVSAARAVLAERLGVRGLHLTVRGEEILHVEVAVELRHGGHAEEQVVRIVRLQGRCRSEGHHHGVLAAAIEVPRRDVVLPMGLPMDRFFDFAKRRIVGYILFWVLALLFLGLFYKGDQPAQAGALLILGLAFLGSLLYTRRMKRRQRARREAERIAKQLQQAYQMQVAQMQRAQQIAAAQPAQPAQPMQRTGGRERLESRSDSLYGERRVPASRFCRCSFSFFSHARRRDAAPKGRNSNTTLPCSASFVWSRTRLRLWITSSVSSSGISW